MTGTDLMIVDEEKLRADEATVRDRFLPKLRAVLVRVPFADDLLAAWFCARDPATPRYVRAVLLGALAYFVIPADAIPDIVATLGFTDDATVLLAAIGAVRGHVRARHRRKARDTLARLSGRTSDAPA